MVIDHLCFAVKDINEGINYWRNVFGYKQMTQLIVNSKQKVKVVFLNKENSISIKLIEPVEGNTALVNFVKRGGGYHHLCFKCDNIDKTMGELNQQGLLTLVAPQSGEAFGGHNIAFLLAKYGINLELIDTDEKAGAL